MKVLKVGDMAALAASAAAAPSNEAAAGSSPIARDAQPPATDVLACWRCGIRTTRAEAELRRYRNGLSACCGDYLVTTDGTRRLVMLGDAKLAADKAAAKPVPPMRRATMLFDSSKGPYVKEKHGELKGRGRP
jgi:hypothetical protein